MGIYIYMQTNEYYYEEKMKDEHECNGNAVQEDRPVQFCVNEEKFFGET